MKISFRYNIRHNISTFSRKSFAWQQMTDNEQPMKLHSSQKCNFPPILPVLCGNRSNAVSRASFTAITHCTPHCLIYFDQFVSNWLTLFSRRFSVSQDHEKRAFDCIPHAQCQLTLQHVILSLRLKSLEMCMNIEKKKKYIASM